MDINGTPLHMVQGSQDWAPAIAAGHGVAWDPQTVSARLEQLPERFVQPGSVTLNVADLRGAACDGFGHVYWIDAEQRGIRVLAEDAQAASTYWQISDAEQPVSDGLDDVFKPATDTVSAWQALRLAGLTVTAHGYLVVGTVAPGGLLIFDLHGGGPPVHSIWPVAINFVPFALAAEPGGGVWILDRGADAERARVWRLDRYLRPANAVWETATPDTPMDICDPTADPDADAYVMNAGAPIVLDGLPPHALAAVDERSFLLLTTAPGQAHSNLVYVFDGVATSRSLEQVATLASPVQAFAVQGHALAFLAAPQEHPGITGRRTGKVYVAAADGNQSFAFSFQAEGAVFEFDLLPDFWPMRRYGGRNLVAHGEHVLYDTGERWIPLTAHPRRRYAARGALTGMHFDSGLPGCVWHRVLLDACIPAGVEVALWARAAEDELELDARPFVHQPALYRRGIGSEVAFHTPFALVDDATAGTYETLLQDVTGRFVEVELRIQAGGRITPVLRSLRVYAPRFSYVTRYLPDVYQQDPQSAGFIERFLANVEGLFTTMEEVIANAEGLFDPRITTPDYLSWLSGWFGTSLDADWAVWRRRLFIRYAEVLYRWRGTLPGLYAMLSLAVDECVDETMLERLRDGGPFDLPGATAGFRTRIVERYLLRLFGGLLLGDPTQALAPGVVASGATWSPEQGSERLHELWRAFLAARDAVEVPPDTVLSPVLPQTHSDAWREFLDGLGFVYPSIDADATAAYRLFLSQRYLTVDALNQTYGWSGAQALADFQDVALPAEDDFPAAEARLHDWMTFATLALPISANAHRFSVLVPSTPGETDAARQLRIDRVTALVAREKPAHTTFDIQPFWALFQVGTARVGLDTILGEGARFTAVRLGATGTGEGTLAYEHPWNLVDRAIAGRDTASEMRL